MNELGARIYEYRKKHELSQSAFAKAVDLSVCYICDIENGKRTPGRKALRDITNFIEKGD